MINKKKKIGDLLIDTGLITHDQLNEALEIQKTNGGKIGNILIENNYVTESSYGGSRVSTGYTLYRS